MANEVRNARKFAERETNPESGHNQKLRCAALVLAEAVCQTLRSFMFGTYESVSLPRGYRITWDLFREPWVNFFEIHGGSGVRRVWRFSSYSRTPLADVDISDARRLLSDVTDVTNDWFDEIQAALATEHTHLAENFKRELKNHGLVG